MWPAFYPVACWGTPTNGEGTVLDGVCFSHGGFIKIQGSKKSCLSRGGIIFMFFLEKSWWNPWLSFIPKKTGDPFQGDMWHLEVDFSITNPMFFWKNDDVWKRYFALWRSENFKPHWRESQGVPTDGKNPLPGFWRGFSIEMVGAYSYLSCKKLY